MKIGIDARPLSKKLTGIGVYLYEVIKQLSVIDTKNEYMLYSNKDLLQDISLGTNWSVVIDPFPIGTIWLNIFIPKNIKKDRLDVFWATSQILPIIKCNCISILTVHDLALLKFPVGSSYNTFVQKLFLSRSCHTADKIISVSESTKNDFIDFFNVDKRKIKVIYNGVTEKLFPIDKIEAKDYIQKKYEINQDFILFLGTIEPRKNIKTIIKAFYLFKKNRKFNCKLVLAGGIGWKTKSIFELVKKLNLDEDIRFLGYIDEADKIYLYNACEFFVFPSIYEGFGIPLLEAMKCGKTTITTNISSMPEVIGTEGAGLMIDDYHDYKTLATYFKKLYTDKEYNNSFREKAIEQSRKFSYSLCAKATLELLLKTCEEDNNRN